jgi:abortive infection bacteriophage resistance protein
MSKQYNKIPLSFQKQIELLQSRNLIIDDEPKALSYLQEISYYRLSAYFLPYQNAKDNFENDITFEQIIKTYSFDRELRLLVFDCIERIEVAIRTQFIYQMALHYNDSHWQDNQNHFITPYYNKIGNLVNPFADFQAIISKAKTARTPETFIKHYISTYNKPANPPSWMCFELLTIGELSHIYRGLKNNADKKRIADFFEVHPTVFTSWLHTLTYVRNICAHHSRLWNRVIINKYDWPPTSSKPILNYIPNNHQRRKIFPILSAIIYLNDEISPGHQIKQELFSLFAKFPNVQLSKMGFPANWQNEPL